CCDGWGHTGGKTGNGARGVGNSGNNVVGEAAGNVRQGVCISQVIDALNGIQDTTSAAEIGVLESGESGDRVGRVRVGWVDANKAAIVRSNKRRGRDKRG